MVPFGFAVRVRAAISFARETRAQQNNLIFDVMVTKSLRKCVWLKISWFLSKDLPNMNTFCDWFSETIVIRVYDSFFGNYISIVLLSFNLLSG